MKFQKILLRDFTEPEFDKKLLQRINNTTQQVMFLASNDPSFGQHLKDADCLLVRQGTVVDETIINQAPKLKYIGILATGFGRIDVTCATTKNITVCNVTDYATEGVAEFTFGAILEYLRELERAKIQARNGDYSEATFTGTEIKGKQFGVIGLGHVGARTAMIAKGFVANVSYWSQKRKPEYEKQGITYKDIDELLKTADILTLNLSLNTETNNFLNPERIQLIKTGALLVNPSPMELLDLDALAVRLQKDEISFILDHSDEMTTDQLAKIKPFKNCVIYPPIAFTTKEATLLKNEIFVSNLESFSKGFPKNKVN